MIPSLFFNFRKDGAVVPSDSAAVGTTDDSLATSSTATECVTTKFSALGVIEHSDAIVAAIVNDVPTCEPGSKFCAPCYELA